MTTGEETPPERGGLGCAMCGDCCVEVKLRTSPADIQARASLPGGVSFAAQGRGYIRRAQNAGGVMREAVFLARWLEFTGRVIKADWGTNDDGSTNYVTRFVYRCLKFDEVNRVCTAHDERPPMCSGYPWYGREPDPGSINRDETRCSYWLDVDPEERPEGVRPLIPLTVLR